MAVATVGAPANDRFRAQLCDLLPDPLSYLLWVGLVDAAVGVVPQLHAADGQRGRGLLELVGSDLGEILLLGAERFACPTRFAACRADEMDRDPGAGVSQDEAAASHGLVIGVGHHDEETRLAFHQRPK